MKKITYSFIIHIIYICYLLQKNGYHHNDLHLWNIMYSRVPYSLIKMDINGQTFEAPERFFAAIFRSAADRRGVCPRKMARVVQPHSMDD